MKNRTTAATLAGLGAVLGIAAARLTSRPTNLPVRPASSPAKPAPASSPAKPAKGAQQITIALPGGYKDNAATVQAGRPVALTFFLQSDAACGNTVEVPVAHFKRTLTVGQRATVVFTPAKSGPLAFACSMNMMKGSLLVK